MRGEKVKKALAVLDSEADVVRCMYAMHLGIEGRQYGVQAIAVQLNAEGVTYRGKAFAISNVHRILTNETYAGTHWFNVKDSTSRAQRPCIPPLRHDPADDWTEAQAASLIDPEAAIAVPLPEAKAPADKGRPAAHRKLITTPAK